MLDFGFSEILLTSAIALVVLGPERLPKVARQVGNWMGRARVMARQLTEQLEREVNADELLKSQTKARPTPTPTPTPESRFPQPLAPDADAVAHSIADAHRMTAGSTAPIHTPTGAPIPEPAPVEPKPGHE